MPKENSPMSIHAQEQAFINDVTTVINRHLAEFDISEMSMIGCLGVVKAELMGHILSDAITGDED